LVREMAIEAELRPDRTVSVAGRARDGERGRVVIQGSGNWTDRPTLEVTTRFVDFQAVRLDAANATVQGAVTLSGNPDRLRLGGDLRVEEASVDISEFLGPKVVDLPVIEVGEPTNPTNQVPSPADGGEPADRSGPVVDLDLGIEIQRATIRGQGLESDWRGRVAVRGTLSEPRLEGPMEVMRGTYSILGKQFTLAEDSRIVFEGRSPPDPRLAVTASLRAEDLTAKVSLSGLAGSPKIDLSSEPLVPKDEILARILFGRKLGTLSTVQQLQLAQAAAELAFGGAGVGFDPVGKVRDFLGFDTLSVGGDAKGPGGGRMVNSSGLATSSGAGNGSAPSGGFAPSVSAGKYLDQDTFLQVGRGEEGGTVSVERQLGGGFSVETEVGARTGGGVSLRWTKDY